MRARRGDCERRARARRRASRGSASVEYGLIVGLIGAVLCLGIGVAVKNVFQQTIDCFIAQVQGRPGPAGCESASPPGGDGGGGGGGSGGGIDMTPGVTTTTSPPTSTTTGPPTEPTDTGTATDSPSPSPTTTPPDPDATPTG